MTNGEKFKTAEERNNAFRSFCDSHLYCDDCPLDGHDTDNCNRFKWLDLETEEEKPMPCPFCEMNTVEFVHSKTGKVLSCSFCGYSTVDTCNTDTEAIAAHNRVCKAVAAYKEVKEDVQFKVGDTIAYRSLDDNQPEWKSFTVRLIEHGYLYEHEDKSGDNIAIECAHKVNVRK